MAMNCVGMRYDKEWATKEWWPDPVDETLERAWQLTMLTIMPGTPGKRMAVRERWTSLEETRPKKKQATEKATAATASSQGNDTATAATASSHDKDDAETPEPDIAFPVGPAK